GVPVRLLDLPALDAELLEVVAHQKVRKTLVVVPLELAHLQARGKLVVGEGDDGNAVDVDRRVVEASATRWGVVTFTFARHLARAFTTTTTTSFFAIGCGRGVSGSHVGWTLTLAIPAAGRGEQAEHRRE